MGSVPLISHRQKGQPWPSDSCGRKQEMVTDTSQSTDKICPLGIAFPRDEKRNQKFKTYPTNQAIFFYLQRIHNPQFFRVITQLRKCTVWTHTCQDVRQDVHMRCPHGSIFTSLSFSAHILHSWNVEPISQYNSYCSFD